MPNAVDLNLLSAKLTRQPKGFDIGAIWFNPNGDTAAVPQVASVAFTASTALASTLVSTKAPAPVKGALVTAPPNIGGVAQLLFTGSYWNRSAQYGDLTLVTDRGANGTGTRARFGQALSMFPFTLVGTMLLEPGETGQCWLEYKYDSAATTPSQVAYQTIQVTFTPGAVAGNTPGAPAIRYWDGDSWRPRTPMVTGNVDLSKDGVYIAASKTSTTTTITRLPTTMTEGETITLTATVNRAAATGTMRFYRSASASGPWTALGSSAIEEQTATKTWVTTAGSWFFRADYSGDATYATSSGVSATTPVLKPYASFTKVVSASWVQPYAQSGAKTVGSGQDASVQQGYGASTWGNTKSLIGFAPGLPADAVVTQVILRCSNWNRWSYGDAGGTLRLGWHSNGSAPSTFTVGTAGGTTGSSSHDANQGPLALALGWAPAVVAKTVFKGISVGPGLSNAAEYRGFASSGPGLWKLEVTYQTRSY